MGAIGSKEVSEEEVRAAFNELDINKDGDMSASELKPAIEKLLKRAPSRKELASLVNSVDDSNDGYLQYDEFLKLVRTFEAWSRDDERLLAESRDKIAAEVFELALREPLLPGFLKLMHLEATIEPLARLGFQTAHDLAYLQDDAFNSGPTKGRLLPVHRRKLLHVAAVLRCRQPPGHGVLTRKEREARRGQLDSLGILPHAGSPLADDEDVVIIASSRKHTRNRNRSHERGKSSRSRSRGGNATEESLKSEGRNEQDEDEDDDDDDEEKDEGGSTRDSFGAFGTGRLELNGSRSTRKGSPGSFMGDQDEPSSPRLPSFEPNSKRSSPTSGAALSRDSEGGMAALMDMAVGTPSDSNMVADSFDRASMDND